jgi:hypothetical protein
LKTRSASLLVRSIATVSVALVIFTLIPSNAIAGATVVEEDDFSMTLGLRMQPRLEFTKAQVSCACAEWQRDFLIRRARITANGKMLDAKYKIEWRIDKADAISSYGNEPSAHVENAYIQWPLGAGVEVRVGLYDQPFSRDRLTSDSKQLAVDRGAVSDELSTLGLADNAFGFHFLGNVDEGLVQYALGLFDNRTIRGDLQDIPMVVGRLDLNFGSSASIFQDAHFGSDSWYSVGLNGSYQGGIENMYGADDGSNAAFGIDGMMDVPAGPGRFLARGEVNAVSTEAPAAVDDVDTSLWMAGLGFLTLEQRLQPIVRFDHVWSNADVGGGTKDIIHIGANFYQKGHNLKIQGDVRLESGTDEPVDGGRIQAQVYF